MTPQLDADDRARAISPRVDPLARREPRVQVPAVVSSTEMPAALPIDLSSVQAALVDALVDRKLLVCVGPLISQEAGLPGPGGLLDLCRQQLAADGQSVDGLSERSGVAAALEWAQVRLRPVVFRRVVREALMQSVAIPATVQALLAVSPGLNNIVTTNLDRLIERAFAGRWPVVDADAPDIARRTRMILKICGTVERPDGWVLTAGQWENAALTAGTPRSEIEALLRNYVVLFVGFAPGDEVFERVLDLRRHVVADERPASATLHPDVALVPAGLRPHERARLDGRGIEAVELAGDYGADAAAYLHKLGEALARRLDRPAPTSSLDVEAAPNTENPYPGLAEFTRVDRRYFFGRDDDIARTLGLLRAAGPARRRWLFLHGPSGIGKSSYLHAGLLPALEEDGGAALGADIEWRIVVMHPGRAPVFSLSAELCGSLAADAATAAAAELGAQILARPAALGEFIDTHLADDEGLLLVVDQLEQALLLPDAALREPFAAALADVLVRPGRPLLLVTSMRSDFVGDLPRLPALLEVTRSVDPAQRRVEYLLAALRTEQLAQAIEGPAREARVELEPGLTRRVLEDAGQLVGGDGLIGSAPESTLPLVAAILAGLYERRRGGRVLTHAAYDELGGVAGALSRRADAAMQPLIADFTEATLWALIRRLVGLSPQGRVTRQSLARAEALAAAGGGLNAEQLLARLADASTRLVVLHGTGEDLRVELVHDSLLHGWTWLRTRLERERSDLLREAELTQAAARWDRLGRPAEGLASGKEAEDFLRAATPPDSLARHYQNALSAQMQALRAAERRRRLAARAVMAILVIGLVMIAVLFVDASRQTRRAEQQTRRVRDAAVLAAAQRALATDAYAAAQLLREIHEPDGLTGWTEAAIAALHRPGLPQRFRGHTGEVHAIEFSGDGEWLATASEDRTARLIPLAGGQPIVFRHEASVRDVTVGTKGESLVTIAGKVQLWWRGRPNSPLELFAPADPSRVAFSPEGAFVAITGRDGARVWRADGVGEPFVFTCPAGQDLPDGVPAPLAWHPRSPAIALACRGRVVVWRFTEQHATQTIDGLEQPTLDLRFDEEGKRLALLDRRHAVSYSLDGPPDAAPTPEAPPSPALALTYDGRAFAPIAQEGAPSDLARAGALWQWVHVGRQGDALFITNGGDVLISVLGNLNELIRMRAPVQRTDPRTGARFPGAWSPGSKRVALVDDAFVVRVWDLDGAAEMPAWINRATRPTRATIRPDGARALLTTGRDVQEIELAAPTRAPRQLDEQVHHAAYHPDSGEVAALGSRGELLLWRPDTGELIREQPGTKFPQGATLAWNRDGTRVALRREAIEVVRVGAPGIEHSLLCEDSTPSHFAWSPSDDALAIGCDNGELRVAELAAGGPPRVLPAREGRIVSLAWSPDGQWIAVAHQRGQGRVWRRDGAVDWKNLDGHLDQLLAVAWSPDGKRLATTGDDGVARLWSSDGVMLHSLLVPAKSVRTISFSGDNTRLATSATDGVVRVYSTSRGELLFALPSFGQEVTSAAFTPDGDKLLVSGRGGAALILADRALLRDWLTHHVPCMTPEALALALGGTDMAASSACSP